MATQITKRNLIEILQDDPVLLEELRSLLLTRELLQLPQSFAEFAESTNRRLDGLEQSQVRLEQTLADFIEATNSRFDRLEQSQVRLEQTLADFMEATNSRFDRLEQTLADFIEATNTRFDKLEQAQAELSKALADFVEATNRRLGRHDIDIGYLKGVALESQLPGRGRAHVENHLNLRSTRVLRAVSMHNLSHEFEDAIYDAEESGILTRRERQRILDTDMVVRGRSRSTGDSVYVAVEASFTAHDRDIDRARQSAEALMKVYPDVRAAAAVYCEQISPDDSKTAEGDGVTVIHNEKV